MNVVHIHAPELYPDISCANNILFILFIGSLKRSKGGRLLLAPSSLLGVPLAFYNTPKKQPQIPRRRDAHYVWSNIDNFLFL